MHAYLSLSNASQIWQDVSIRSCMILCHQRNHKYAALHNGNECACLNDQEVSRLEKLPAEACDIPCNVNDEERCGGKTAASIFLAVARSILSADERTAGLNGESVRDYLKGTRKEMKSQDGGRGGGIVFRSNKCACSCPELEEGTYQLGNFNTSVKFFYLFIFIYLQLSNEIVNLTCVLFTKATNVKVRTTLYNH